MAFENTLIAGRYQLGRIIGGGAIGNVYLGKDGWTGETVAIKQLRRELTGNYPEMVQRFLREGEILRRLNHPNIVKVLATVEQDGEHFIVMEYVAGGSLADLLTRQPRLAIDRAVSIALELSDALSRAHHLNILHRDLKPANILLAADGTPRLTDFGLARVGGLPGLTEAGSLLGTFPFMSPEAVENRDLDERSDIWSFGVVLFEMLTGCRPFEGDTPFDVIWAIKNQTLPPPENLRPEVPPALSDLVRRMLRKDSAARVSSVRQVGVELEKIYKGLPAPQRSIEDPTPGSTALDAAPAKIRVLLVDDHAIVRQGLRTFIDLQVDMEVVGEASDGREALELAEKLVPDVILLDLVMPEMDGVQATARIKARLPATRVVILTSFGEDDKVLPAIRAGAQGYLLKNMRPEELVRAVREAYQGKIQLHPEIAARLVSLVTAAPPPGLDRETRETHPGADTPDTGTPAPSSK